MNKLRSLVAVPLIAVLAVAFAACGGGDDDLADLDPAEVLRETFSSDHELSSGVFGLNAEAEVPGEGGGSGSVSITAPFNDTGEGEIPEVELGVDLQGEAMGQSLEVSGGGTLTPDGATIRVNDTNYEVPAEVFREFTREIQNATEESSKAQDLDVDPVAWFTNLSNAGAADVDGTETVRITGDADIEAIGRDIFRAIEESGIPGAELPPDIDPSQLGLLEGFIDEASFEVFSEPQDEGYLLRRLDFTLTLQNLAAVAGGEGPDTASFEVSLTMSEPDEEQTIELPEDTQPFSQLESDLEEQFGGLLGSGISGGLGAAGGTGGTDELGGAGGGGGGGSADAGDVPGVTQEYLDCIENATPEELELCAEELGP